MLNLFLKQQLPAKRCRCSMRNTFTSGPRISSHGPWTVLFPKKQMFRETKSQNDSLTWIVFGLYKISCCSKIDIWQKHRMWMSFFWDPCHFWGTWCWKCHHETWRIKGLQVMYAWDSFWAKSSYTFQLPKEFSCEKFAALCALCYRHSHDDGCVGDILCSDIRNRRLELKFTDCPCENSKSERWQVCQLSVEMLHFSWLFWARLSITLNYVQEWSIVMST